MTTGKALDVKPYAGNPHVQFDAGKTAPAATPRRGSLLCRNAVIALAATAAVMSASAAQTLRVVSREADKTGSWADAYTSIADAINAAGDGVADTILVGSGTYDVSGSKITVNKMSLNIRSANLLTGEEDPENTILDGGGTTQIMEIAAWNTTVSGLTFANGLLSCETYDSAATFFDCVFRGNSAGRNGLMFVTSKENNNSLLRNCLFADNTQYGQYSNLIRLQNCTGAIGVRLENCTFAGNVDAASGVRDSIGFSGSNFTCTNTYVNSVFTTPVSKAQATAVASNCCFSAWSGPGRRQQPYDCRSWRKSQVCRFREWRLPFDKEVAVARQGHDARLDGRGRQGPRRQSARVWRVVGHRLLRMPDPVPGLYPLLQVDRRG